MKNENQIIRIDFYFTRWATPTEISKSTEIHLIIYTKKVK
jgi:hypothetical protein